MLSRAEAKETRFAVRTALFAASAVMLTAGAVRAEPQTGSGSDCYECFARMLGKDRAEVRRELADPGREYEAARAYETQRWPKTRVVVRDHDRNAWIDLDTGKPTKSPIDRHTDVVVPAADETKGISCPGEVRHLYVGKGIHLKKSGHLSVHGNVWIRRGGFLRPRMKLVVRGGEHTFFRNDNRAWPLEQWKRVQDRYSYMDRVHARKWIEGRREPAREVVRSPYAIVAQYLRIRKREEASVWFIGHAYSSDELYMHSGCTVVGPGSVLEPGDRAEQRVDRPATLRLMSNARFQKVDNQIWGDDLVVRGGLEAGSPERPITRDCYLGLSFKDPQQHIYRNKAKGKEKVPAHIKKSGFGLVIDPGARVRVYTRDPKEARLVIRWHGQAFSRDGDVEPYDRLPRQIDVLIRGEHALNAVHFDYVRAGGIRLTHPASRQMWRNVTFGPHSAGPVGALIREVPEDVGD